MNDPAPANTRRSMPVAQLCATPVDAGERDRLAALAQKLIENDPALTSTSHFGPSVNCGLHAGGPALLLADQSEISLYGAPEDMHLEYRLAALAQAGDMLVLSHDRSPAFENYLHDYLGISGLDVMTAASRPAERLWPLPKRCLQYQELFQHIAHRMQTAGLLTIVPYLSTGHVWNLARRLAEETGIQVAIAGPPPRLARRVNDKVWFANRVRQVLGKQALSPSVTVYGPAALTGHALRMASGSQKLVIKIPDSAGSVGNLTLDTAIFHRHSAASVQRQLLEMLAAIGWQGRFPLKIESWEEQILSSPSVQMWIPDRNAGRPIIEGVFEQIVEGAAGKFTGAIKSSMPTSVKDKLTKQAVLLALLFQQLGYFGRCSMDALITGADYGTADLHWIECNGRWGGVSVPMTLVNRLLPEPEDWHVMIVQRVNLELPPRSFQTAVDRIDDLLFRTNSCNEGIILLTPTGYERGAGVHFMALARTQQKVRELSRDAMMRLTEQPAN
ncbi:MAG: hypothetical protein OER56_03095 [Hyphomicrobiales bacterium]|nr:hypothetical protein [Hyphomicrobiales bacterium]